MTVVPMYIIDSGACYQSYLRHAKGREVIQANGGHNGKCNTIGYTVAGIGADSHIDHYFKF